MTCLATTCYAAFSTSHSPVPVLHAPFTVPVPAPPPEIVSASKASTAPSSADALDDSELKLFLTGQRNSNTERKTRSDLNVWQNWCRSVGETRPIEHVPPTELNKLLAHFFTKVKKRDGISYEPDSLTSLQRSLERHLRDNLGKQYSILRDREFALSREAIIAARKKLKKEGKGNMPRASEPLESEDFERLWERGALGDSDPETLQNSVWLMVCMHMGMRGRDEHHKLRFGDFTCKETLDGKPYVEFNERDAKTRSGAAMESRAFKPKMWSNPQHPERCPCSTALQSFS